VKDDFLFTSLMGKFPQEVENIDIKDLSFYQALNNIFLNLYLASSNGNFAHYIFRNKHNIKSNKKTNPSGSHSSNLSSQFNA
jgi:hypothetical protein